MFDILFDLVGVCSRYQKSFSLVMNYEFLFSWTVLAAVQKLVNPFDIEDRLRRSLTSGADCV